MATLADKIRKERAEAFIKVFDTDALDAFVVDEIKLRGYAHIGLCHDSVFESGYLKQKRQKRETDCKWLAFADWYECYIWRTDCQIPYKFESAVAKHLMEEGFHITYRGACGYDKWDIMVVTL